MIFIRIMINQSGIEGNYIVHANQGYEYHEERINQLFKANGLSFEFVTDGDPSCFSEALLDKYFTRDIQKQLSTGILSCTLNHILSYERVVKNQNKYALIFENDPFFLGDFPEQIKKIAREADTLEPGFLISLENTTLKFPPTRDLRRGKLLYQAGYGRFAGAYLMDLKAATDILEDLKTTKCNFVIDWWHNSLIKRNIVKMYWADPPIVEQGSHNGLMSSTISSQNKNIKRRLSWLAQKYYKTYIARWFK